MPETCTCGSQLPPDAVFCHKCGKPQREIAAVESEAPAPPPLPLPAPVVPAPVGSAPVNFRNMDALKTALMAAVLATFLLFLPYLNWLAAGYFAVFFYRRRTRQSVNIAAGVRIGWLTGLMTFAILAALMVLVLRSPGAMEMMKVLAQKDGSFQQMLGIMQNGPQLAGLLATLFVFVTFLSMTGGLLGAVLTGGVNPRPRGGNNV
jgi:hypothetical protein